MFSPSSSFIPALLHLLTSLLGFLPSSQASKSCLLHYFQSEPNTGGFIFYYSCIYTLPFLLFFLKKDLFERSGERERENLLCTSLFPRKLLTMRTELAGSVGFLLGLPWGWQESKYLEYIPLLFQGHYQGIGSEAASVRDVVFTGSSFTNYNMMHSPYALPTHGFLRSGTF